MIKSKKKKGCGGRKGGEKRENVQNNKRNNRNICICVYIYMYIC